MANILSFALNTAFCFGKEEAVNTLLWKQHRCFCETKKKNEQQKQKKYLSLPLIKEMPSDCTSG